jgi:phenylacetate-CoA ligase
MAEVWKTGLEKSLGKYTCLIDADLQYQPEDIIFLYNAVINNSGDLTQGSRGTIGRLKDFRFFLSRRLSITLNILFSMNLKDNKSGFILCGTETLKEIFNVGFKYKTFQTFLLVATKYRSIRIREIDVFFLDRLANKSFISQFPIKLIAAVLTDLVKAIYEFLFSYKNVSILAHFLF